MRQAIKHLLGPSAVNVLRRGRTYVRHIIGRDVYFSPDLKSPVELVGGRPGTGFGAWYLVPIDLGPGSVVYSFGIGDDISFDLALIARYGCTVHAFDPTPDSHAWLARQRLPAEFKVFEYGVAAQDGTLRFYPAAHESCVSHSVFATGLHKTAFVELPVKSLSTLMRELGHDHIDLLKMDIEGCEYEVIEDLIEQRIPCKQLLVEYHHRSFRGGVERTEQSVEALRQAGYRLVRMATSGEEFTFLHAAHNVSAVASA